MPEPPPSADWSDLAPEADSVPPVFEEEAPRPARRLRRLFICLGLLVLLLAAGLWAFLDVGRWLVVEDPLRPAAAIVVLSGQLPERAMEAARLYRQNMAAQVWVSQGLSPASELEKMHITYLGEDFYNQKVLLAMGVPADAIHVLDEPSANTAAEVAEISRTLRSRGEQVVIVVTSKAHTRRVRYIWKRLVGDNPRLIVRYTPDDPFDPAHWWRSSKDGLDIVRELLGLANAALGFPAQPVPR